MEADKEKFIQCCYRDVFRYLYVMLKNRQDAEDAAQETFYRFLTSDRDLGSDTDAKAYVFRIAVNLCKNYWRSGWYRHIVPDTDKVLSSEKAETPKNSTEHSVDMLNAMLKLPKKYRNILHLHYYDDMPVADIAALLSMKENTVKSLLKRGREKLKNELGDDYEV